MKEEIWLLLCRRNTIRTTSSKLSSIRNN